MDKFNAFGQQVPGKRMDAAYQMIKKVIAPEMDNELCYSIVAKIAGYIQADTPFKILGDVDALDDDLNQIDLTGRYMLMAALLTDPGEPPTKPKQ
jgi:hypothetical protein